MNSNPIGFSALLFVLLAAGCAVLTVDVDVYKGALANTEEIQTEQVISIAMAAKPLLVQLRDHLAVSEPPFPTWQKGGTSRIPGSLQERLHELRRNTWYRAGFMAAVTDLRNEFAIRVNEILALYEARVDANFATEIILARKLAASYQLNFEVLHPASDTQGQEVWRRVASGFLTNGSGQPFTCLSNAYYVYFHRADKERFQTNIFECNIAGVNRFRGGSNAQFEYLFREGAEHHAGLLFANANSPSAREFIEYVRKVSEAFLQARQDLHDVMTLALQTVAAIDASRLVADPGHRIQIKRASAEVAANLINMETLQRQLKNAKIAPPSTLNDCLKKAASIDTNQLSSAPIKQFGQQVLRVLAEGDGMFAEWLLCVDFDLRNHDDATMYNRFGLARGPTDAFGGQGSEWVDVNQLFADLEALGQAVGGSLARGRPAEGLEELIERFFSKPRTNGVLVLAREPDYARLTSALINFGQKVASLGNSTVLLGHKSAEVDRYISVLQAVGNSIVVQIDELRRWSAHNERMQARKSHVLNAITRHSNPAMQSLTNFTGGAFDAKDVIEQLIVVLRADLIASLIEATDNGAFTNVSVLSTTNGAVNLSVLLKHYESSLGAVVTGTATNNGGTVTLTNMLTGRYPPMILAQAIREVIQMRGDMIYLRPASAYLRSSYPSSALRNDSSQGGRNMLIGHGLRQTPLGFLLRDSRESLDTWIAVDAQSWQSINHIRVSGVGDVNYALVKDDIGNWYLKQYAADPTNVWKSMANVAAFSSGTAFGARMPIHTASGTVTASPPVVALQMKEAAVLYDSASTNAFFAFAEELSSMESKLTTALGTNAPLVTNALAQQLLAIRSQAQTAVSNALGAANASNNTNVTANIGWVAEREVFAALEKLKRLPSSIISAADPPAERREQISTILQKSIRELIVGQVRKRDQALSNYETAIAIISKGALR